MQQYDAQLVSLQPYMLAPNFTFLHAHPQNRPFAFSGFQGQANYHPRQDFIPSPNQPAAVLHDNSLRQPLLPFRFQGQPVFVTNMENRPIDHNETSESSADSDSADSCSSTSSSLILGVSGGDVMRKQTNTKNRKLKKREKLLAQGANANAPTTQQNVEEESKSSQKLTGLKSIKVSNDQKIPNKKQNDKIKSKSNKGQTEFQPSKITNDQQISKKKKKSKKKNENIGFDGEEDEKITVVRDALQHNQQMMSGLQQNHGGARPKDVQRHVPGVSDTVLVNENERESDKSTVTGVSGPPKAAWGGTTVATVHTPVVGRQISEDYPTLNTNMNRKELKKAQEKETTANSYDMNRSSSYQKPFQWTAAPGVNRGSRRSNTVSIPLTSTLPPARMASLSTVNDEASLYIHNASEQGMRVTLQDAIAHICARFGVQSLQELGIRDPKNISCLKKHSFTQSRVSAYVEAYSCVQAIGTLYDLGKDLARDSDKEEFSELYLGPLTKQPLIRKLFSLPQEMDDVPRITVTDVLMHLKAVMEKRQVFQRITLKEFLDYVKDQYGVSTPWELGIKINSIGLGVSVR